MKQMIEKEAIEHNHRIDKLGGRGKSNEEDEVLKF